MAQTPALVKVRSMVHPWYAKNIWLRLVKPRYWPLFFNTDLHRWMKMNLSKHMGCLELDRQTSFATACWSIWRWRNEEIFGNGSICADPYFTVIQRTRVSLEAFDSSIDKSGNHISRVNRVVRWEKPEFGWVKVNVDGACTRDDAERAACGGVIRDAHGRCLVGFTRRLGSCSSIHAELWGVLSGLEIAIRNTIIDTHPCASIIQSIQTRSRDIDEVIFKHVYREGNRAADAMAALAHDAERSLCFLESIPAAIAIILEEDLRGVGVLTACSSKKEKERVDGGRTRKPKTEHKENQNSLRIHHCGSLGSIEEALTIN
ncbi:non-LTR retroelement reverse transcriptase-like [Senna tora]|uniref:Non-LTR retroelement reverse transcriptase-like n=1 Tax=Senna tora TaxID=362788 RepID=A0A834WF96_9FABA|nr:non-LTR retroelement reverse transcriptase-like [Senna tora]